MHQLISHLRHDTAIVVAGLFDRGRDLHASLRHNHLAAALVWTKRRTFRAEDCTLHHDGAAIRIKADSPRELAAALENWFHDRAGQGPGRAPAKTPPSGGPTGGGASGGTG